MSFGNWPVASLRQRAVYKTEFDIFKQNTDIDLISLLSYEDHTPRHLDQQTVDVRPKTVPESRYRTCGVSSSNGYNVKRDNRKRISSAYDQNNKTKYIRTQPERDFKRSAYIRSNTSVYKAFARTSRTFLRRKQNSQEQRKEIQVNRECNSALDIRKPAVQPGARSQTTCGFRPNERNLIKPGSTNTPGVKNVSTINRDTRPVNKTERSILNHIWRTKSAPTVAETNKHCHANKHQSRHENTHVSDKRHDSEWTDTKHSDCIDRTKTCFKKYHQAAKRRKSDDKEIKDQVTSPGFLKLESANNDFEAWERRWTSENTVQIPTENTERWKNLDSGENKTVTIISQKEEEICENFSGFIKDPCAYLETIVPEDGIGSKDSGFASNAVSPELEFWHNGELDDDKSKHVKFQIDNEECTNDDVEAGDAFSAVCENGNSDTLSETANESENRESSTVYDIDTLITDLERFGANSRLSAVSIGGQSNYTAEKDDESLCGEAAQKALDDIREAEEKEKKELEEEKKEQNKAKDIENLVMSKEARHAIMETLKDMGSKKGKVKNKENGSANIRYKGVNAQRRQHENRHKYEFYMRERTNSVFRNQFRSMDSVGNDDNSSTFSSPREARDCDDNSSEEHVRGKLFPSIRENTKLSKATTSTSRSTILTLENAKKTKYKIPGIGNYHLIASPENDFEITPPGFDSRYNQIPGISKDEMEIPPRFIRERSIEKCKSWLTNINMSPLALRPAKRNK